MFKRTFLLFILLFVKAIIFPQIPVEKAPSIREGLFGLLKSGFYYTVDTPINIRFEPNLNSRIIGQLELHEKIEIVESAMLIQQIGDIWADWYKIKYKNSFGYIWGGYIAYKTVIFDINGNGINDYFQFRCRDVQAYTALIDGSEDIFIFINNKRILTNNIFPSHINHCDFLIDDNKVIIKIDRRVDWVVEYYNYEINTNGNIIFIEKYERQYGE